MSDKRGRGAPQIPGEMMTKATQRARIAKRELDDMPSQLAALETMSIAELAQKFLELYGEPTRSRNRVYLKRRLAWRIQANAQGGLSDSALARIEQLGGQFPERWQMRLLSVSETSDAVESPRRLSAAGEPRDPRVPAVGTVIRRVYDGLVHEVTVCADGFEYAEKRYKTLSAIAKLITGTRWNGFLFFGLNGVNTARKKR